jgi:hypothetical protein
MPLPLQVIETGDRCVYRVHSERSPKAIPYTVDLLENGGIGTCTCKGFQTTTWPKIRDGKLTLSSTFPCHPDKHLQAARGHFFSHLLATMAKAETQ